MGFLNSIWIWFSENYGWAISLLIQVFIAYHVFFLSKRLSRRARLEHKEKIKFKADQLLSEIHRNKLRTDVYLVNVKRYFKDYPSNKEKMFEGYSHIRAGIKASRFDGIEFFSGMPIGIYQKADGRLSMTGADHEKVYNAFPVGIVPYEWIEHIDSSGDEFAYFPLIYCRFKGRTHWRFWRRLLFFGFPYKHLIYYRLSDTYREGHDPTDMKYTLIQEPISQ